MKLNVPIIFIAKIILSPPRVTGYSAHDMKLDNQ